jgi:hypothetical protein
MLRLTAKSTQFGRKTFTSWLIESAGTVPIKRRKDYIQGSIDNVDNSEVMGKLMEVNFQVFTNLRRTYKQWFGAVGFGNGGRHMPLPRGREVSKLDANC